MPPSLAFHARKRTAPCHVSGWSLPARSAAAPPSSFPTWTSQSIGAVRDETKLYNRGEEQD
jgi:hypothetical protein